MPEHHFDLSSQPDSHLRAELYRPNILRSAGYLTPESCQTPRPDGSMPKLTLLLRTLTAILTRCHPWNDRELATPPLDGTILPGVTRDSILQLTAGWGEFAVTERHVTIREAKKVRMRLAAAPFDQGRACRVIKVC